MRVRGVCRDFVIHLSWQRRGMRPAKRAAPCARMRFDFLETARCYRHNRSRYPPRHDADMRVIKPGSAAYAAIDLYHATHG